MKQRGIGEDLSYLLVHIPRDDSHLRLNKAKLHWSRVNSIRSP